MAQLTSYFTDSQSREQRGPGKAKSIPGGVHMQINGMRGLCCGDVPKLKTHCQMRPIPAWGQTVGGGLNVLEKTPGVRQFGKFRRRFGCGRRGSGQSLGCDFKAHEIINGFAHARLRQLLVGAKPEVIVESGPDCGVMPAFFNESTNHGFKRALLVWGEGSVGSGQLLHFLQRLGFKLFPHGVECGDIGQLHAKGLFPSIAHHKQDEAVEMDCIHGQRAACGINKLTQAKIGFSEIIGASGN